MRTVRHIEMYDSQTFCGRGDVSVPQGDWHHNPIALSDATCLRCLAAVQRLGFVASRTTVDMHARGESVEAQLAAMDAEDAERERKFRESGAAPLTIAGLGDVLKDAYDPTGAELAGAVPYRWRRG